MNNFYIDNQNGRSYYAYNYQNGKINYIALKPKDITTLLKNCSESPIENIISKENYHEVIFCNGINILVESINVLYPKKDAYDKYFQKIAHNIKNYQKDESLKQLKYKPKHLKVNRKKAKLLPKKQIIATSLSLAIAASLISGLYEKETKKKLELEPNLTITKIEPNETIKEEVFYTKKEPEVNIVSDAEIVEPDYNLDLAFDDRSSAASLESDLTKLEETKAYYGDIISYYSNRYGLPYELVCAQITQERPHIKDGVCDNICQITYRYFVDTTLTVPVYDESGFTGEYDIFLVTKEMLDSPEGNIKVGIAYLRICVDKFNSLIIGLFSYNQGDSALGIACNYYGFDKEDYFGDENALKARDIINRYYEETSTTHGDKDYLEHVLGYLDLTDRTSTVLEYYLGSEKKSIEINNTLYELGR